MGLSSVLLWIVSGCVGFVRSILVGTSGLKTPRVMLAALPDLLRYGLLRFREHFLPFLSSRSASPAPPKSDPLPRATASTLDTRTFVSVIIPAFNEGEGIVKTVRSALLTGLRPMPGEVIVVDGGSTDGTREAAAIAGAKVIEGPSGPSGRAQCLNAGAAASMGDRP